ncbi:hypothetical protein [Pontibacter russatus]|uniref:hypothetical protein n=1 Tax=Pontibacter russatus TaxID=2694929 RepID=UPI00137B486F|nr:hypothetical protein [Pontibacter russatus]
MKRPHLSRAAFLLYTSWQYHTTAPSRIQLINTKPEDVSVQEQQIFANKFLCHIGFVELQEARIPCLLVSAALTRTCPGKGHIGHHAHRQQQIPGFRKSAGVVACAHADVAALL